MDCIFCKIINNQIPSYKIYEDDNILVILDINPKSNGHMLVIPKKHYKDMLEIDEDIINNMHKAILQMHKLLVDKLNIDGLTIVQNNGLGQDIKHYHIHLVPTYNNKVDMSIEEVFDKLKQGN